MLIRNNGKVTHRFQRQADGAKNAYWHCWRTSLWVVKFACCFKFTNPVFHEILAFWLARSLGVFIKGHLLTYRKISLICFMIYG